ncbi:methyltransferase domain-containing protein [bacterium]|nr:methyltransferase domain-containing protein [bacterium]
MNPGLENNHTSIYYYDSDYPSPFDTLFPENFDAITEYQGLAFDIERYRELAKITGGPVLELCCGTGRVAIPLARDGFGITGVDISPAMLQKFKIALENEEAAVRSRVTLVEQDITRLSLTEKRFKTCIIAFNSLLCIPDFEQQCAVLHSAASHLAADGRLLIDIVNPLQLDLEGDPVPKPFFTRRDRSTGNTYTRFFITGPFETDHKQKLSGWYDEITPEGFVKRRQYSLYWRPIFRFEIELMLREAGLRLLQIEGGHRKEPYTAQSPRMFLTAGKG